VIYYVLTSHSAKFHKARTLSDRLEKVLYTVLRTSSRSKDPEYSGNNNKKRFRPKQHIMVLRSDFLLILIRSNKVTATADHSKMIHYDTDGVVGGFLFLNIIFVLFLFRDKTYSCSMIVFLSFF
jgi:hypothetical protein